MKNENEVYNEILTYINGDKHNRPCTLASIKKIFRTKEIIELIFSRPDIFNLVAEIKHVPSDQITNEILVKYVLSNPYVIERLDDDLQTLPVMVAFEFSKRRYEYISAIQWGSCGEKIPYSEKIWQFHESISNICDNLGVRYNDDEILRNYLGYIDQVSRVIIEYCKSDNINIEKKEKYELKYQKAKFCLNERLFIFVSGWPDSGKTTFSNILSNYINDSIYLDSDTLLKANMICEPLSNLACEKDKVIILSDIYANRFFKKEELVDAKVINVLVKPVSIEKMYRHSKYMQGIPFETYKKYEIESIHYDSLIDPIVVTNDYTDKIQVEVDKVLEEISKRLGIELLKEISDEIEFVSQASKVLKK